MRNMPKNSIHIRDQRDQGWFWGDNEFLDYYGEHVGNIAVAVYMVLCRHSNNITQDSFPSLETIAKKAGLKSKNSAIKGVKILEDFNIISVKREYDKENKKQMNNVYTLLARDNWVKIDRGGETVEITENDLKKFGKNPILLKSHDIKEKPLFTILPEWLSRDIWDEWVLYRKEIKKKLTDSTIKSQIKFLEKHKTDHIEIIRSSIMNGWTGLFPLKKKTFAKNNVQAKDSKYANVSQKI